MRGLPTRALLSRRNGNSMHSPKPFLRIFCQLPCKISDRGGSTGALNCAAREPSNV